jgi:hypothetical protein
MSGNDRLFTAGILSVTSIVVLPSIRFISKILFLSIETIDTEHGQINFTARR